MRAEERTGHDRLNHTQRAPRLHKQIIARGNGDAMAYDETEDEAYVHEDEYAHRTWDERAQQSAYAHVYDFCALNYAFYFAFEYA